MANSSGSATSPVDLLQNKIVPFLTGNGWTLDLGATDGSGYRAHLHNGSFYINFRALMNEASFSGTSAGYGLVCYVSTGYNGSNAWNAQPGGMVNGASNVWGAGMVLPSGSIVQYDLFQDSSANVWIVVEKTANIFGFLGFGNVSKIASFTGGAFVCGSSSPVYFFAGNSQNYDGYSKTALCPFAFQPDGYGGTPACAYVRGDIDTITGGWIDNGSSGSGSTTSTQRHGSSELKGQTDPSTNVPEIDSTAFGRLTGNLSSIPVLLPIRFWTARDAGGMSPLCTIPDVYLSNATNQGYSIRQDLTIGGNTYQFYPNFAILKV